MQQLISFVSGNTLVLDENRLQIRENLLNLEREKGSKEAIKEEFIQMNCELFVRKMNQSQKTLPGFDPEIVLRDVVENRFELIYQAIVRDY